MIKKQPPPRETPLAQALRSSQQFNATPRFNFSSTPKPTSVQPSSSSTPLLPRFVTPARQKIGPQESIEDSFEEPDGLRHSLEEDDQKDGDDCDTDPLSSQVERDYDIDTRTAKRQRVSYSPANAGLKIEDSSDYDEYNPASSPTSILSSPAIRRPTATHAPKFMATPAPSSTPFPSLPPGQTPFLKPPRFRPTDSLDAAQTRGDPLPDQFSPHRKGQKYVPGGLAAEVRDWLVDINSSVPSAVNVRSADTQKTNEAGLAHSASRGIEEIWVAKIIIEEISGSASSGMTLARGHRAVDHDKDLLSKGSTPLKIILAGEGQGVGLQKGAKLEVGGLVGIKGPAWEVVIEGEKWGVAVEWKVLR